MIGRIFAGLALAALWGAAVSVGLAVAAHIADDMLWDWEDRGD